MCIAHLALPDANRVYRAVACGKCVQCVNSRIADWIFRFEQERLNHSSCIFLTLTYKTKFLPRTVPRGTLHAPASIDYYHMDLDIPYIQLPTLKVKDLQDFWKRLRYFNKSDIKYYVVGEYGKKHKRPHYHAIVFGVDDRINIEKAWSINGESIGRVDYPEVTQISGMTYIFKYISKFKHYMHGRKPEFSACSKGIGLSYLTPAMLQHFRSNVKNACIISNGIKRRLPRFYKTKVFTDPEMYGDYNRHLQEQINKSYQATIDKIYRKDPTQSKESIENMLDYMKINRTFTSQEKQITLIQDYYEQQ